MARNEEKAMTLWNKWQTFKTDFHSVAGNRRPLQTSECESLPESENKRRELIRDASKKISQLQNATLGEHRIREINDEINKIMRTKHFWEIRIRELGGDVSKGKQHYDIDGKELPGAPGYKYYGVAKDLPGVRELFSEQEDELLQRKQKRTRAEMFKFVTPDYYGYRDDDDGILVEKEAKREALLQNEMEAELRSRKKDLIKLLKQKKTTDNGLNNVLSAKDATLLEDSDDEDWLKQEIIALHQVEEANMNSEDMVVDKSNIQESTSSAKDKEVLNKLLIEQKKNALLEQLFA